MIMTPSARKRGADQQGGVARPPLPGTVGDAAVVVHDDAVLLFAAPPALKMVPLSLSMTTTLRHSQRPDARHDYDARRTQAWGGPVGRGRETAAPRH